MLRKFKQFFSLEATSGVILLLTATMAMIWANSPLAFLHDQFINDYLFWINEGLMTLFFLQIGLEIKQGFLMGKLANLHQVALPLAAAVGGMVVPALLYIVINHHHPETLRAWATPVATDIAFALGALSLLGARVPPQLKLFLLLLAIFDDIGAIIIIATCYSHGLSSVMLLMAAVVVATLYFLNRLNVKSLWAYLVLGVLLWFVIIKSGIHPTVAGVLLALMIPSSADSSSPLNMLETFLNPLVAYIIMPLFALANAGFSLHGVTLATMSSPVVLGIVAGLFIGKQLGVFGFSWLLIRLKWVAMPAYCTFSELYGVAILCGIGFTMSLFLGTLSFGEASPYLRDVRLGVLLGSLISGIVGLMLLSIILKQKKLKGAHR